MAKRREINIFSISFLDLLSGALGAVIILFVAVPKAKDHEKLPEPPSQNIKIIAKNQSLKAEVDDLKLRMKDMQVILEKAIKERDAVKEEIKSKVKKVVKQKTPSKGTLDADVGFKFKGKNILFLIDVSGSMHLEDRMGQVKAGLKMLITSMPKEFKIDVIQFPGKNKSNHYSLWSYLQNLGANQKLEVYRFLSKLNPRGATPTRSALRYALSRYPGVTDIVLLSDGAPTIGNSRGLDNIYEIIEEVKTNNVRKIQINTIGVGSSFFSATSNPRYIFLKTLSENHNGFFYGF
ncbi:hypothetical protein A9Q84_12250 [Halobacteriovorax marinus]|uniref:VWFA domain-containing protein n=1 Tax=Halobacteriovorax marinus TaxID=97084 RepID=A0A1Y5F8L3_9BACT|nr:hypothetical protein A9Q84_12250 [Halobacteriovorax marinus]